MLDCGFYIYQCIFSQWNIVRVTFKLWFIFNYIIFVFLFIFVFHYNIFFSIFWNFLCIVSCELLNASRNQIRCKFQLTWISTISTYSFISGFWSQLASSGLDTNTSPFIDSCINANITWRSACNFTEFLLWTISNSFTYLFFCGYKFFFREITCIHHFRNFVAIFSSF